MRLDWWRQELRLRHTWTTAHGTQRSKQTLVVRLEHDGMQGYGEIVPVSYHGQSLDSAERALGECAAIIARAGGAGIEPAWESPGPPLTHDLASELRGALQFDSATLAGIDAACWDWIGKRAGTAVHNLLADAVPPASPARIGMTLGAAAMDEMLDKARAALAQGFSILKVKLGVGTVEDDVTLIRAIRALAPHVTLRVDANEGWHDEATARAHLSALEPFEIELIEQPLPRDHLAGCRSLSAALHTSSSGHAPRIVLDEDCVGVDDVTRCKGACSAINIKLSKCGGITPAIHMIRSARSLGLRVMLGAMIESSLGIAAAAQLSPFADYLDLDSHLLLEVDPWEGLQSEHLPSDVLELDAYPGLGVRPKQPPH